MPISRPTTGKPSACRARVLRALSVIIVVPAPFGLRKNYSFAKLSALGSSDSIEPWAESWPRQQKPADPARRACVATILDQTGKIALLGSKFTTVRRASIDRSTALLDSSNSYAEGAAYGQEWQLLCFALPSRTQTARFGQLPNNHCTSALAVVWPEAAGL
jgi:hypothetical protein